MKQQLFTLSSEGPIAFSQLWMHLKPPMKNYMILLRHRIKVSKVIIRLT